MMYPITNKNLGMNYSKEATVFNVWAPTRHQLQIALYEHHSSIQRTLYDMTKEEDGVHTLTVTGDLHGYFYTILIEQELEITDPYSITCNANSQRSAIVDLLQTDPEGFKKHRNPSGHLDCDAILYELHVKDFTGDKTSGVQNKGKYIGLTEENTHFEGYATGLDHIVDLGVTHVHLMPVSDYLTVDELVDSDDNYNWGYDPELFNTPEGSYSKDAHNPVSRIFEFKQMVQAFHEKEVKVILDVVYNHTYRGQYSNFNALVPNYYYRTTPDGAFSNGSGCGNEFASETPMGRKFIVESLCYWAKEYKVDGFRFDLMALIDFETIQIAITQLKKINPEIMIYGEPWIGGLSTLPDSKRVYKGVQCNQGFALFNDNFRNAIKGDNDGSGKGFVQGNINEIHDVKVGIAGSIPYDNALIGFAMNPNETINYFNAHDNLILFDKIAKSMGNLPYEDWVKANKLCFDILMTSQGIPFIHAGNEFLRNKKGHHNSYNEPLSINGVDWNAKKHHYAFYNYVKDLIELRKTYDCFRMKSSEEIKKAIRFIDNDEYELENKAAIVYTIHSETSDAYDCLLIAHNASGGILKLTVTDIIRNMCCDLKLSVYPKSYDIEITEIFNESGIIHEPLPIPDIAKHIVGVNPRSTAIFKFKKLDQFKISELV